MSKQGLESYLEVPAKSQNTLFFPKNWKNDQVKGV